MTSSRSFLQHIFLSPQEARLRAGWRLLLQILLWFAFTILLGIPFTFLSMQVALPAVIANLLAGLVNLLAVTLSVFLARRLLDRRSFVSLGLVPSGQAWLDVLIGIAITFIMMGGIFLTMQALGWLRVEGFLWQAQAEGNGQTAVMTFPQNDGEYLTVQAKTNGQAVVANTLLALLLFILVGWQEELLSRGYHLQTIASGTNLFWGVFLSSAAFGILHLGNPHATWVSTLGIFLAGLFLAYGYLRTGQLWLSIGLHIGWNFFEGVVFGFPVSGLETYRLLLTHVNGPELWTGGAFGPEAGLILIPAMAVGSLLIYLYTRRRPRPVLPSP